MISLWAVFALAHSAMPSQEVKLPSGATLIAVPRKAPWTSFAIALPFGSDGDPAGKAGLARAGGLALAEHIQNFAERGFERMGAAVDAKTGRSATILIGGAPADRAEEALDGLFRALAQRTLAPGVFPRAIEQAIAERRAIAPERAAAIEADRILFGLPPSEGEVSELSALAAADVDVLLAQHVKSSALVITLAGSVLEGDALTERARTWTALLSNGTGDINLQSPAPRRGRGRGRRIVIVDRPYEGGAYFLLSRSIGQVSTERLPALLAAAASVDVMGAHVELDAARGASTIALRSADPSIAKTLRSILGTMDKTRHGQTSEAIAVGRRRAATRADMALADPDTHALAVTAARIAGRPAVFAEDLARLILAAGDAEVAAAARAFSADDELAIVVVTSASPTLSKELAGVPGVRDVSIVSGGDR